MTRLLDTNVCIAYLHRNDPDVTRRIRGHTPDELCVCSVVKAELIFGARNSERVEANLGRLQVFFEPLESFPTNSASRLHPAPRASRCVASLRRIP